MPTVNGIEKTAKTPKEINHLKRRREKLAGKVLNNFNVFVVRLLAESYVVILILQFLFDVIIPDHDADAFRTTVSPPIGIVDDCLRRFLAGCQRWDAQHYLHIAMHGYTYENNLAFFPLFPIIIRNFAVFFDVLFGGLLSQYTCLLLTGTVVNFAGFCGAGYFLYRTTLTLFDNATIALITAFAFSLNPASVFFHVLYTESLFSFLTFLGLFCVYCATPENPKPLIQASVCFALSCLLRSNGLLNFGYVAFACLIFGTDPIFLVNVNNKRSLLCKLFGSKLGSCVSKRINGIVKYAFVFTICSLIMLPPFLLLQYHQYVTFCTPKSNTLMFDPQVYTLGRSKNYTFPGELTKLSWCNKNVALFQLPYTAVQSRYWNVKFLGYYEWKKLPNFLLAFPTFLMSLSACFNFLTEMRLSDNGWLTKLFSKQSFTPYILHVLFLTFVGAFFINVEVITRMLFSSSPLLFWHFANCLIDTNDEARNKDIVELATTNESAYNFRLFKFLKQLWRFSNWKGKCILLYFVSYTILGTALHANFLPWT